MAFEAKPWHDCEDQQQSDVHRPGYLISGGKELCEGSILKDGRQREFCYKREDKCQNASHQRPTRLAYGWKAPEDVPRREEDHSGHDWHFRELCPALADTRDKEWNPEDTQHKASTKHDGEVHEACLYGL